MSVRLLSIAMLSLLLGACAADEQLAPVGSGAVDAGDTTDAGSDAAPPPPPVDAGTVKRTVMVRNPFGGPAGNHLADGDFELSTTPYAGGQLGWRAYAGDGSQDLVTPTETGGLCRSGLRCAVMTPNMLFILRGTSAKDHKGNIVSGWAKVPEGSGCGAVRPVLITCDTFAVAKQLPGKKADDGWCHYTAAVGPQDTATCLYIENSLKMDTTALVDAFVLGPDDGTVFPESAQFWAPEADLVSRLETLRTHVITTMPFAKPERRSPPTP